MIHDPWSMIHDPWSMIHDPWSMIHDPWSMIQSPTIACVCGYTCESEWVCDVGRGSSWWSINDGVEVEEEVTTLKEMSDFVVWMWLQLFERERERESRPRWWLMIGDDGMWVFDTFTIITIINEHYHHHIMEMMINSSTTSTTITSRIMSQLLIDDWSLVDSIERERERADQVDDWWLVNDGMWVFDIIINEHYHRHHHQLHRWSYEDHISWVSMIDQWLILGWFDWSRDREREKEGEKERESRSRWWLNDWVIDDDELSSADQSNQSASQWKLLLEWWQCSPGLEECKDLEQELVWQHWYWQLMCQWSNDGDGSDNLLDRLWRPWMLVRSPNEFLLVWRRSIARYQSSVVVALAL